MGGTKALERGIRSVYKTQSSSGLKATSPKGRDDSNNPPSPFGHLLQRRTKILHPVPSQIRCGRNHPRLLHRRIKK